jgi:thioredoxin 1
MLLFFTAEWCVPCRIMKREVVGDADVMRAINDTVVPVMVHQGEPGGDDAFSQYQVGTTPVTMFTDPDGHVLSHEVGGIGKARFLEMLAALEAGPPEPTAPTDPSTSEQEPEDGPASPAISPPA